MVTRKRKSWTSLNFLKFTSSLSYIASIMIFERVKFSCLRTRKLRDSGNFPYG